MTSRSFSVVAGALATILFTSATFAQDDPQPPVKLNAAHILIGFKGAERSEATRTKEEALKLATTIAAKAKQPGADFAELAKEHSEGPSGKNGGDLGTFNSTDMVKPFSDATRKLKVGEVSAPVESRFGFHVILRKIHILSAAHILIRFKGSERAGEDVTRSKEEALALATKIAKEAQAPGANFGELAKKHSEGPSAPRGGNLGTFEPNQMVRPFSVATAKLKVGQVSGPVESQFGYHVIQRKGIAAAKHILVQWKGSARAAETITRTKAEAMQRMQECIAKLKKGEKFEELAKEYSDGPSAPRGGDLGEFAEGMMVPAFDKAIFGMKVGGVSDVVETDFGFHIIYRYQ